MVTGKFSGCSLPSKNTVDVFFHAKVSAIAPGQSAVFYEGDDVVGGGIIEKAVQ